jgi:hypothetical protein
VRVKAATDIGRMGPRAKAAVPALAEMLSAPASDNVERMAAAMALGQLGPSAKDAIPVLQQAAKSGDDRLARVADLAMRRIDPPISETIAETVMSPYVLASLLALGGGLIALFLLGWRRGGSGGVPDPVWKIEADKRAKEALEKAQAADKETSSEAKAKREGADKTPVADKAPVADKTPTPPGEKKIEKKAEKKVEKKVEKAEPAVPPKVESPAELLKQRARVSRPLANLGAYVQEQESSESAKRELMRAQDDLKAVSDQQRSLAVYLEKPEITSDPERARALRKDIDEYAIEHYRLEVRVKALEVKVLELLLSESKTSDAALRERSETMLKQKWDDLRALCETPAKIVLKSDQWVSVQTGPKAPIEDLRAWLRDKDVVLPERKPEEPASA